MVSPPVSVGLPATGVEARSGFTFAHSDFACAFESSRSSGTFAKFGSALKA
jgi:hypothetical protein